MVTELAKGDSSEAELVRALCEVRTDMWNFVSECKDLLGSVHPDQRQSACNLVQYLAFRQRDLRPQQDRLAVLGMSSLGRAEAHVMASVDAVLSLLHRLGQQSWEASPIAPVSFSEGEQLLSSHAEAILGPVERQGSVRIMVTMPTEAAGDYVFVRGLLGAGMDCMRINCAHDDADTWVRMVEHLRKAEQEVGRPCKVHMDLGGTKLRTGSISARPGVLKVKPRRNDWGRVIQPARVLLQSNGSGLKAAGLEVACLQVEAAWLRDIKTGDVIRFQDARGAKRRLLVREVAAGECVGALSETAYFESGQVLWNRGPGDKREGAVATTVGQLPECPGFIRLRPADVLILKGGLGLGNPAVTDADGHVLRPAEIGCEPPEILKWVSVGDRVWLDDGNIGGKVQAVGQDRLQVLITATRAGGGKLRGDKGINFPDSPLALPALTNKDRQALTTVVRYADTVGLSFCRSVQDVLELQESIRNASSRQPSVILKIETKEAFQHLPQLLLAAMRNPKFGVMIARGDLAVECGYERLAEAQEEILWLCEAAHVPVVWATQVLDTLAQEGIPTRAEISDAVLAQRAECVMLNKGPFILPAIKTLKDIVDRMAAHQSKKRARLRALQIAYQFSNLQ